MWEMIICGVICFTAGAGIGALIMGFINIANIDEKNEEEKNNASK